MTIAFLEETTHMIVSLHTDVSVYDFSGRSKNAVFHGNFKAALRCIDATGRGKGRRQLWNFDR
jgi:hypothetical protein